MLIMVAKLIGAGLAVIGLGGTVALFAGYLLSLSRNPFIKNELFSALILRFTFVEAVALFGLLISFLILFTF